MTLTAEERERRRAWFESEFTTDTYFILRTLEHFNLNSRVVIAEALARNVYGAIEQRSGDFAEVNDLSLRYARDLVNVELLSTLFMAIEDLGKILVATRTAPPRAWAPVLVHSPEGRSLGAFRNPTEWTVSRVKQLLSLREADEYGVHDIDGAIPRYHEHVAEMVRRLLALVGDFIALHRQAYDKYKHGNPLLFAMQGRAPRPRIDAPLGVLLAPPSARRGEVILVGPLVVERQLDLIHRVVQLSRLICRRWVQVAEFGNLPPPVLTNVVPESDGIVRLQATWLPGMPDNLKQPCTKFAQRALRTLERVPIEIDFQVPVENRLLDLLANFYTRDWPSASSGSQQSRTERD